MLSVKNELLQALAASLDKLSPGAGSKAIFESPKVAAHGDFATTAAMQLAKPLKLNPRQLAENLRTEMLAQPAFVMWVDAVEIAGPLAQSKRTLNGRRRARSHVAHGEKGSCQRLGFHEGHSIP